MNPFWDADVPYIGVLSPDHAVYLIAIGLLAALLVTNAGWVRSHREGVRWAFVSVALAQMTALYVWYALETSFDLAEALPLHISRVTTIVGVVALATLSRRAMDVQFFFSVFAYASFAYPQLIYPPTHLMGLSYFASHAVTLLLPAFFAIAYGWAPTVRALWVSFAWFLVYFAIAVAANALVGGNYFYLRERPFLRGLPSPAYEVLAIAATVALFWIALGAFRLLRAGRGVPAAASAH